MRATGYACDVCKVFATAEKGDRPPNGWMSLTVFVTQEVVSRGDVNTAFHICSNKCLKDLGTVRWRAERDGEAMPETNGSTPVVSSGKERVFSDEARAAFRQNGLKMQHGKGNHADNPNSECELCIAEYQS